MLGRYTMHRGKRPAGDPLPEGTRQDTRKHTRHVLRPATDLVQAYLSAPGDAAWEAFRRAYLELLAARFAEDPAPFEALAELAGKGDVWLGCSCPTRKNPDPSRCHTVLALGFMAERFPELELA